MSHSLLSRSLLSPTALALALTTALAPIASADRISRSEMRPIPSRRMPPYNPVITAPTAGNTNGFAQPPAGWAGSSSFNGANPSEPPLPEPVSMPVDGRMMRPPVIVTKSTVRAALEQARTNSLDAFKVYFTSQVYPSNTYTNGSLNVWRDEDGHYCAAATIIRISGRIAISEEVPATNNNLRLINVTDGPLMDWILTSGLTQQEIDQIQEPFIGVEPDGPRRAPPYQATIDQRKKAAETARLAKVYRATYAKLLKNNKASLEVAVNRLMAHPQLAREFLDGTLASRDIR